MKKQLLEVCVDSVESALAAYKGGADRLELCGNLIIGGTTPSLYLFDEIRKKVDIPIHILIRPRYGDFCYSTYEFEIMLKEIKLFQENGANGVVIGCLKADGSLNLEQLKAFMQQGEGMSVTLHRAFDVCKDPILALEQAIELGINQILTSGQEPNCVLGIGLLKELVHKGKERIDIMAGGAINASNIKEIARSTGVTTFHMSGKEVIKSPMRYQNSNINMGDSIFDETVILRTNEEKIRKTAEIIRQLQ